MLYKPLHDLSNTTVPKFQHIIQSGCSHIEGQNSGLLLVSKAEVTCYVVTGWLVSDVIPDNVSSLFLQIFCPNSLMRKLKQQL